MEASEIGWHLNNSGFLGQRDVPSNRSLVVFMPGVCDDFTTILDRSFSTWT